MKRLMVMGLILATAGGSLSAGTPLSPEPLTAQELAPDTVKPLLQNRVHARPVFAEGAYAALWGGANVLQQSSAQARSGVSLSNDFDFKQDLDMLEQPDWAFGAKAGYTWGFDAGGVRWLPSLEAEFIYTETRGAKFQWSDAGHADGHSYAIDATQDFSLNIYALTVNPIMRVRWGMFRPYLGFGVGAAYVDAGSRGISGTYKIDGQDAGLLTQRRGGANDQVLFCFQGIAGTDIFLYRRLSVFVEYKYLGLVGLRADKNSGEVDYSMDAVYGNHLAVIGVRYFF